MPKLGYHQTEEHKQRNSAGHLGQISWNKGIPMLEEAKTKLSVKAIGRVMSPEFCTKDSIGHMGHITSSETKAKMTASRMGHVVSPETCVKISIATKGQKNMLGHHHSAETCAKMSASKMGHPASNWKGGQIEAVRRRALKRRSLGFNPLNSQFPGCEAHHINNDDVIYMSKKLHRSIYHNQHTGRGMVEMNKLASAFLTEDWT